MSQSNYLARSVTGTGSFDVVGKPAPGVVPVMVSCMRARVSSEARIVVPVANWLCPGCGSGRDEAASSVDPKEDSLQASASKVVRRGCCRLVA